MDIDRTKLILVTIGTYRVNTIFKRLVLQSNRINTDTDGAIESVHINRVSLQPLQGPLAAGRE